MQVTLINGARCATVLKDAEWLLSIEEGRELEPVTLTIDRVPFDCLAGRVCQDDPYEVWAVDVSGYWMRVDEVMPGMSAFLDAALQRHMEAEEQEAGAGKAALAAFGFPSIRRAA